MRERGLVACQPKRSRNGTTRQAAKTADIPDLVVRDFTTEVPGAKLVGDITYVRTCQGWLFVALVIDCCSRAIVGWVVDSLSQGTGAQPTPVATSFNRTVCAHDAVRGHPIPWTHGARQTRWGTPWMPALNASQSSWPTGSRQWRISSREDAIFTVRLTDPAAPAEQRRRGVGPLGSARWASSCLSAGLRS